MCLDDRSKPSPSCISRLQVTSKSHVTIFGLREIGQSESPHHLLLHPAGRSFHGFSGTMSVSNEIDDLNGCYSTPSPALSSLLLADHSPNVLPLSSNSRPPNLCNITSSPFSTTKRSVSLWPDNFDAFYNRQRRISEAPFLFNKEGSASSAMPVPYARDLGRQFGQHDPDEIYTPRGCVSGSLTCDLSLLIS